MPAAASRPLVPEPTSPEPDSSEPISPRPPPARPVLVAVPPLPEPAGHEGAPPPDPDPEFVKALAVRGYEVIDGSRTVAQLGPLVSVGLARQLAAQRALRSDRRIVYRDRRRRVPHATTARIDRSADAVAEAAVVLHLGPRVRAVALRLEWVHQHWRACELFVL